jgi:spermidine synthase
MLLTYILVSVKHSSWSTKGIWLAAIVFIVMAPSWNKHQMGMGLFRVERETPQSYNGRKKMYDSYFSSEQKLVDYKDGPSGTISVYHSEKKKKFTELKEDTPKDLTSSSQTSNHSESSIYSQLKDVSAESTLAKDENVESVRSIMVNGKSDGSTQGIDLITTKLLAHLPALLHSGSSGEAAVIGFGTGITVGNLALYEDVKNIDTIEISNVVKDFSKYFNAYNLNAGDNPKVNWIIADAYRVLTSTDKFYDVIISEPSNPWVTGVEKLYTQEFYRKVKDKLSSGGVYAQWFHSYSISEATLGIVMNTYASVFPHAYTFASGGGDLIILGSLEPLSQKNIISIEKRYKNQEVARELKLIGIESPAQLLQFEVLNSTKAFADSGLHLLDFPKLSYKAGKDFFLGKNSNIVQVSEGLFNLPFNIVGSSQSLFSTFLDFHSSEDSLRKKKDLAQMCPAIADGSISSKWLNANRLCRGALFQALRKGWFDAEDLMSEKVTKALMEDGDLKKWSLADAKFFLIGYERVHSNLFPIPKSELLKKTEVCLKHTSAEAGQCVFNLVHMLYSSGLFAEAETILATHKEWLKSIVSSEEFESIESLNKRSRIAFGVSH